MPRLPHLTRPAAALAALLLAAVAFSGCGNKNSGGGGGSTSAAGKTPGVLRYALTAEPTTLDPGLVSDGPTIDLLQQVYEGLVGWSEKNEIVPKIAAAMPKVSADGRTYTFTIRDGVKFHNGRAVTAEDVKYSITRSLEPKLNSPVAMTYLNDIVGAKAVRDGKTPDLAGVKVVDPKTVTITIDKPRAYFLGKLTYPTGYVLAKEEVEKGKMINGAHSIDGGNVVGTGPFKLATYVPQSRVVIDANADYWDGKPKLSRIERPIILDAQTARNLYDTGGLDIVEVAKSQYEQDQNDPKLKEEIKLFPRAAVWYVGLNQTHYAPFKDKRVRLAFAHAIDKDAIIKNVLLGVPGRAEGILPEGLPGFDSNLKGLEYNPELSKKLLAEAGFPEGKGLPPLVLSFRQKQPDIANTAQVLKEQLAAVGITISLNEMEWATFLTATNEKRIDLFHMRWSADYLDPQDFLSVLLHSGAEENRTGYANPAFDALLDQADSSQDTTKRMALYNQAEKMVIEDAPWVPIYFQKDIELHKPWVKGVRDSLMGHLPYTTTTIE